MNEWVLLGIIVIGSILSMMLIFAGLPPSLENADSSKKKKGKE